MENLLISEVLKSLLENRLPSVAGGAIYREAAGFGAPEDHLALINEWTRSPVTASQVYTFPALAIDEQATRNYVRYTAQSQRASVGRWVGIPFLFNEDSQWASLFDGADHSLKASSQMGRIYKSDLVRTPEGNIGTLIHAYTVRGVDEKVDSFISRVDAGLLREVSIHVMVPEGVKCNICSKMYPCGDHEIAQEYKGVPCTVDTVGAFVPLELSSVACPGSIAAHIMPNSDTANYKALALREALGSIRHLKESSPMFDHKSESCTNAECAEDICKERIATATEAANKTHAETCQDKSCAEALCEANRAAATDDDPEEGDEEKKAAKAAKEAAEALEVSLKAPPLFTEDCPACGRGSAGTENAVSTFEESLAPIRADFQERVTAVVAKAEAKISEATAKLAEVSEKASQFDAMFAEMVATTVEAAVANGNKQPADVTVYSEELTKLGFAGVKLVREAMKSTVPTREAQVKRVAENARERATRLNGATSVIKTESGSQTYVAPRLA